MKLIGRDKECQTIRRILRAGRHVLLEGPVGVGKTTIALAVASETGKKVVRVDGDGRYTEQKLVGSFDPRLTMERGFVPESFLAGPLTEAMEGGHILLINELNRMSEMVQNVLLPALDEGKLQIPMFGEVLAKPGFSVIATQNPREFVATSALSEALLDRLEWVAIHPLGDDQERDVVRAHLKDPMANVPIDACVAFVALTRKHPKIKRGASIRATIALASLLEIENCSDWETDSFFDSARSVLANRIELQAGKFSNRPFDELLTEVLDELRMELQGVLKKKS